MKVGIMQPYFFPYIGYISLIDQVDEFILLDAVQYIRHGWIERNRIISPSNGWQYIKVPLVKHSQKTLIEDIKINNNIEWKKKILSQLCCYRRAPYYSSVINMVEQLFDEKFDTITQLNYKALLCVLKYLEIETHISIFSNMNIQLEKVEKADEWALNICKKLQNVTEYWNLPGGKAFFDSSKYISNGIEIKFQQMNITKYHQFRFEFQDSLSILDVMMFNNKSQIRKMMKGFELI